MTVDIALREAYLSEMPVEAARSLEQLPDAAVGEELRGLSPDAIVRCLDYVSDSRATQIFDTVDRQQQLGVLTVAPPRLALKILDSLEDAESASLLAELPGAIRDDLVRLRTFAPESAGRLLDRPYDTIRDDMTVATALERLKASGARHVRQVYVVNGDNVLTGKVDMQVMAMASPDELMGDLLEPLEGSLLPTSPRTEIVEQLERHRVDSLPVVDLDGRLLGVVRHQRLFAAVESVATADIQTMVGASADERALSHPLFSVKRRLPWLHINLLTAFLAAAVVGAFEGLIAQFTALAVLLPVVAGQSGNAGSQALAVTMRGLALREVGTRQWRQVLTKEVFVGLIDGVALAVTCGLAVYLWSQSIGLSVVIAVAMILSMIAAGISGALVPMVLTRLGQDPATASSIILTTVTDVAGFLSFLGTATLLAFML